MAKLTTPDRQTDLRGIAFSPRADRELAHEHKERVAAEMISELDEVCRADFRGTPDPRARDRAHDFLSGARERFAVDAELPEKQEFTLYRKSSILGGAGGYAIPGRRIGLVRDDALSTDAGNRAIEAHELTHMSGVLGIARYGRRDEFCVVQEGATYKRPFSSARSLFALFEELAAVTMDHESRRLRGFSERTTASRLHLSKLKLEGGDGEKLAEAFGPHGIVASSSWWGPYVEVDSVSMQRAFYERSRSMYCLLLGSVRELAAEVYPDRPAAEARDTLQRKILRVQAGSTPLKELVKDLKRALGTAGVRFIGELRVHEHLAVVRSAILLGLYVKAGRVPEPHRSALRDLVVRTARRDDAEHRIVSRLARDQLPSSRDMELLLEARGNLGADVHRAGIAFARRMVECGKSRNAERCITFLAIPPHTLPTELRARISAD